MVGISLRLPSYPLSQFPHANGGHCHPHWCLPSSTECRPAGSLRNVAGSLPTSSPAHGEVPPRYQKFSTTTDPAATLWPSALLPTPTFLRGLSPRGQEGFASSGTTLPCVLSPLPRRARPRSRPTFPRPVLPSPRSERLGTRCFASRGLCGVRYLRPAGSLPDLLSGLSGGTAPGFRLQSVSSASWCWLLPCWGFHPLGHTDFTGHARSQRAELPHWARCGLTYSAQRTERASPALCPVRVLPARVPLGQAPFLPAVRRSKGSFVPVVRRYYGPVRLLAAVHHGVTATGLSHATRRGMPVG
jgi:hypothetical protein